MSDSERQTLILSADDIETIVKEVGMDELMDQLIKNTSEAFSNFDPNKTVIPTRSGFNYTKPELGLIEWMPLHDVGEKMVVKMVGYHPDNPKKYELPTIVSTISNYDTKTGHLKSIVDGVFLTALRTGSASAVASQLLANPESETLGLIGCGAQAITQLHALSRVFPIKKVIFYDIDESTSKSFIDRVAILELPVQYKAKTIQEIVEESDIICTATSIDIGKGPLFKNCSSKEYLHINAIGSDFPGKTELPIDLLKQSYVCPDFPDQAIKEGECQQLTPEDIGKDLFHCIKHATQYQYLKNQRTVFDSTGLPLEDLVVMDLFLSYAKKMQLGQLITIESMSDDAKNPYHFIKKERAIDIEKPLTIKQLAYLSKEAK